MKKRLLCLVMVLSLCLSAGITAQAADEENERLQVLSALGVMNGDENGELHLSANITRAQFAKMAAALSNMKISDGVNAVPFDDVPAAHWAASYVAAAAAAGWLNGYPDGSFRPEQPVTQAEAVTVFEKLLGYSDGDFVSGWPVPQLALARSLGLIETATGQQMLTRRECALLAYNTLNARNKEGIVYAQSLGYLLNDAGTVDGDALVASVTEGPVLAEHTDWSVQIGFTPMHIWRNGAEVSRDAIQPGDVLYYSEKMSAVWAWNRTVTGILEAVEPNSESPDRIQVSGQSYTLTTSGARYAVSALGEIRSGDRITVRIGRDGTAAAVFKADDTAVMGVVTAVGAEAHVTSGGDRVVKNYMTLTATDGISRKFMLPRAFNVRTGDIVSVRENGDDISVSKMTAGGVAGRVNSSATQIGTVPLRTDAEVLDVSGTAARKVPLLRLAGITLAESDVLACVKDASGQVSRLVLNDVTGDMHSYGLLLEKTSIPSEADAGTVYYRYMSGGVSVIYPAEGELGGEIGGIRIVGSVSAPAAVETLHSAAVLSIGDGRVTTTAGVFSLNSAVQAYILSSGEAQAVKPDELSAVEYRLTAWYDALPSEGGALRVVTAEK